MTPPDESGARILVLAPRGRDAELTRGLLSGRGIEAVVCFDLNQVCAGIKAHADAAIIAEEALTEAGLSELASCLARQPPWSDFPIVMFGASKDMRARVDAGHLLPLGNVTVLDRPVQVRTMMAAVTAALRARRRQYEARRAIRSRDEFLAMLGHELRSPLAAISLASELLERDPDDAARKVSVIRHQARTLTRLVDDLLDTARVTHGKVVLKTAPLDLAEVVRETIALQRPNARASGLDLTAQITAPLPIAGDRVRLEQVLANLLANAFKYTPAGGSVRVEAGPEGGRAVVRVIDTGIGIEPEMIGRVFDMFAQADQGLSRSRGGMGLGLTLVQSLVHLHGGNVSVTSGGTGRGSTFMIDVPLTAGAAGTAQTTASSPTIESSSRRVVVVEDVDDLRDMFQLLLERLGHAVDCAANGPDAVGAILARRPDFAFVDIGLPGFDGLEVARRVRAAGYDEVVMVALTGYGQDEDRKRALEAGFDAHLTKPVDEKLVRAALTTPRRSRPSNRPSA